jgi:hypothetical protein
VSIPRLALPRRRGRLSLHAAALGLSVALGAFVTSPANAQTILTATDATSLSNAIDTVNAGGGTGGPYTINITQSITLSSPLAPILNSVTINGARALPFPVAALRVSLWSASTARPRPAGLSQVR